MKSLRKRVLVWEPDMDHGALKAMYVDRETGFLYPDVCLVNPKGKVAFQSNSLCLRGPDTDERPIGVVWGDSTVFGLHEVERTWPEMLSDHFPEILFLNGGIEGAEYLDILKRAVDFNREHAVAVNVMVCGYHRVFDNKHVAEDLENAVSEIPNLVLSTLPTSLNAAMIDTDISHLIHPNGGETEEDQFFFWGSTEYSVRFQKQLFAHIQERNASIRTVASRTGTVLVDLYAALVSQSGTDFRRYFFDVAHPRDSAYPVLASIVAQGVREVLERRPVHVEQAS